MSTRVRTYEVTEITTEDGELTLTFIPTPDGLDLTVSPTSAGCEFIAALEDHLRREGKEHAYRGDILRILEGLGYGSAESDSEAA